jgi:hypothetical protein
MPRGVTITRPDAIALIEQAAKKLARNTST